MGIAVFDIMGGYRDQTASDGAYSVLVGLTIISFVLFIPLLLGPNLSFRREGRI
jgi:hypothetical protein